MRQQHLQKFLCLSVMGSLGALHERDGARQRRAFDDRHEFARGDRAGAERRRVQCAILHPKDICHRGGHNLATFVKHHRLIEITRLRFFP